MRYNILHTLSVDTERITMSEQPKKRPTEAERAEAFAFVVRCLAVLALSFVIIIKMAKERLREAITRKCQHKG